LPKIFLAATQNVFRALTAREARFFLSAHAGCWDSWWAITERLSRAAFPSLPSMLGQKLDVAPSNADADSLQRRYVADGA